MEATQESNPNWEKESVSLLALSSIKGVGYWTLYKLATQKFSFYKIVKSDTFEDFISYFSKADCKTPKKPEEPWETFQKNIWAAGNDLYKRLRKAETRIIHYADNQFPDCLRHINEPPRWLFVQGDLSLLHKPAITIVGTRQPSYDGIFLANYIGTCLPYLEASTVSGLATGIDQIVHNTSIRFQVPTIAVLGNGVFVNYPSGSEALRYEICVNGGAVVTEYLPEQSYSAENFVRRNRIQAALGNVLIPVEWKSQSGTAHTVRYASSGNKPIFCLKLPDWHEKDHSELSLARELGGKDFIIPIQSNDFIEQTYLKVHGKLKLDAMYSTSIVQENPGNYEASSSEVTPTVEQLDLWSSESNNPPSQHDKTP